MSARPYIYGFDGNSLTDGSSYPDQQIRLQEPGSAFSLRRILGLSSVAANLQLRRPSSRRPIFSKPAKPGAHLLMNPPMQYRGEAELDFDLGTVARASTANAALPIYRAFLGFQGILTDTEPERLHVPANAHPWRFVYDLSINWFHYASMMTGEKEPARAYGIPMYYGNAAIYGVEISNAGAILSAEDFALRFYDGRRRAVSNIALPQSFYNSRTVNDAFLIPPLIFKAGEELRFDVVSLLSNTTATLPQAYQLTFRGVIWE